MYRKEFPEDYERLSLLKTYQDNPDSALNIGTLDEESIIKLDKKFDDLVKNVPSYEVAKTQTDLFEPDKIETRTARDYYSDQAAALREVKGANTEDYDTNYKDIEPELSRNSTRLIYEEIIDEYPDYLF